MHKLQLASAVAAVSVAALLAAPSARAQRDFSEVEIKATHVEGGIHMLQGAGGNIGVIVGDDGVFLIDDQYAPLTEKIKAAVAEISKAPIRFVLNTHWHGDHTGGNENLGKEDVLIVAHDNVRERMSVENIRGSNTVPASPEEALPVITFNETSTFHFNGEALHAFHVPHAHTDGDSIVHFSDANVIHMGDIYFNGMYPFLDVSSGGSIGGLIAAVEKALGMIDGDTKVIPGHGPLSDRDGLRAYGSMLKTVRDAVAALIADGKDREGVLAAKPAAALDATWGQGFFKADFFVGHVYDSLTE